MRMYKNGMTTTLLDVLPVILGHWTYSRTPHVPSVQEIATLSVVCKSIHEEMGRIPRHKLFHTSMCCQVPLLGRSHGIMSDPCCIDMLVNSYVQVPRYLDAMSAIHTSARENVNAIIAKICSQTQPTQNIGSDLVHALSPKTILHTKIPNDLGHVHIVNTLICLSILMGTSYEIYDTMISGDWSLHLNLPNMAEVYKAQNVDMSQYDSMYSRHVDFRLHTTYLFFFFVGNIVSAKVPLGFSMTRTLQGQLMEAWRTKWNENNRRMYTKTMFLLDRVYDKLAREYGPPPSIVIAQMMAQQHPGPP
jgi:hypothetical protein